MSTNSQRKKHIDPSNYSKEELVAIISKAKTMAHAAETLGIDRKSLYILREKFGIMHIPANKTPEEVKEEPKLTYEELVERSQKMRESDPYHARQQQIAEIKKVTDKVNQGKKETLSTVDGFMKHFGTNPLTEKAINPVAYPSGPIIPNNDMLKHQLIYEEQLKQLENQRVLQENKNREYVEEQMNLAKKMGELAAESCKDINTLAPKKWTEQRDEAIAKTFGSPKRKTHIVIPDCQIKPGIDFKYLEWIGKYIAETKPDRIINLGDFADMECLYNYKKDAFSSSMYKADIKSANEAMRVLMQPIKDEMKKCPEWKPTFDFVLGNHENRIVKVKEKDEKIADFIDITDLEYAENGWTVHTYLKPVILDDIAYAHFFTSTLMGNPIATANNLLTKKHMSCVMGHRQEWEMARKSRADGTGIVGLIAGSCYMYDPEYLGPQGNDYSRQIWVLKNIEKGSFNPERIDLKDLQTLYGEEK